MAEAHQFTPADDNPKTCGHIVRTATRRWGSQTCGFPEGNSRIHPPGSKASMSPGQHLTAVPTPASVRLPL